VCSFDFVLNKKGEEMKRNQYSLNKKVERHSDSEYDYTLC